MSGRRGWRRAAVAAVVVAAATTGVQAVHRDPNLAVSTRAAVGTRAVDSRQHPTSPSATLPLRGSQQPEAGLKAGPAGAGLEAGPAGLEVGRRRGARWVARDAAEGWEGPPNVRGPVVVGGLVLAVGGGPPPVQVSAYDVRTGRPCWHYRTGGALSLWAASRLAVVVGSDRGELDALEPATGRRRWRLRLATGQGPDAATLWGDRLVVATSFPGEGDLRPPVVYALDAGTGRRRWRAVLRPGTDLQWGAPVLAGGLVLVASTPSDPGSAPGHALHAIDAATGRVRWEFALPPSGPGFHAERPRRHGGLVLVPAAGGLLAVDPGAGREVWRRPGPGLPLLVGATGGLVVALVEDGLVALSVRDGRERWRLPLAAGEHRFAAAGGGQVVALANGLAVAVDPASGAERWRSVTGPAAGPPLVAAGRVYVPTTGGLVALAAASGRLAWVGDRRRLTGGALAAGGRVLVTARAGDLLGYAP